MHIDVFATHNEVKPRQLKGKTVVVIDALRATSVICTALANGAKKVKTTHSIEEALQQKAINPELILGGERYAGKISGFDLGNSPLEYTQENIQGKTILLSSTNGTQAVQKAMGSKRLIAASFLNLQSVVRFLLEKKDEDLSLICSGTNGQFSMDDALCAGMLISELQKNTSVILSDLGNLLALPFHKKNEPLLEMLAPAKHVQLLKKKGYQADIAYCLHPNILNTLPIWDVDGFIDLYKAEKPLF